MKRLLVLTSLLMVLTSIEASAENKPQLKMFETQVQGQEAAAPVKKKFVIYMKDGGSMVADNYAYDNGKVKIILQNGTVSFDKSMVLRIEEVKGEEEPVRKIYNQPSGGDGAVKPYAPKEQDKNPPSPRNTESYQPKDDNGNTESWWRAQVNQWNKKLVDAQARYSKAQDDWNRYNGLVGTLPGRSTNPTANDFQATQYQDLRGAARVAMDQAQADMDEAKKMLEEGLPDKARKAGAPPGWVR